MTSKTELIALDFTSDIKRLTRDFTGRKWLLDEVDAWLKRKGERFFILTGEPGVGKSAFIAWLTQTRKDIGAFNFCIAGRNETNNPNTVLRSLGAQLGHFLSDYGKVLANTIKPEKLSIDVKINVKEMAGGEITGVIINHLHVSDPKEVLEIILRAPLAALPETTKPIIILIDSLDEAVTYGKNANLVTLLAGLNDLPSWVRILCTSRPERSVLCYFDGLSPYILAAESKMNLEDVEQYITNRISREPIQKRIKSARKDTGDLTAKLIDKDFHKGNFLFVKKLIDDIEDGQQPLNNLNTLPRSIDDIYHRFLMRFKARWEERYQPILGILAVTREPVNEAQLANFTGIKRTTMRQSLGEIIQFLDENGDEGTGKTYVLYHESFRDYLLDEKRNVDFWCASEDGHQGIIHYYLKRYGKQCYFCDNYGIRHLPEHLTRAGETEILKDLLFDFDWLAAKLERTNTNALITDYDLIPNDQDLHLIQGAIRLSANALIKDKTLLAGQLFGRLMNTSKPRILSFLQGISLVLEREKKLWLRPFRPSLFTPGASLFRTLKSHNDWVLAVAVSPDNHYVISGSSDATLKIWDLASGNEIRTLKGHTANINAVTVTPDGLFVISASNDRTIRIWDLGKGIERQRLKHGNGCVEAVAVTPDGRCAISASVDKTLTIWDIESGKALRSLSGHEGSVSAVAVTPDGHYAISASLDFTLKIWDLASCMELRTLKGHTGWVKAVAVTPDGKYVISGSVDKTLKVWDLKSGHELRTLKGHSGPLSAVAITPDGRCAISASADDTLIIWDIESGNALRTLEGHIGWVFAVAVTPDGNYAISASNDNTLKMWDIKSVKESGILKGHSSFVKTVATTPDGSYAISASHNTIKIWDLYTGTELRTLNGHLSAITTFVVTPDGRQIVSISSENNTDVIKIWDILSGKELRTFGNCCSLLAITPDGRYVISNLFSELRRWDLQTGSELLTLKGHIQTIEALVITLDSHYAVTASNDWTIRIWDLMDETELHTLRHSTVYALASTPDSRIVISASRDGILKAWDLSSGSVLWTLKGHSDWIKSVIVSQDGHYTISASVDCTLKKWDIMSGTKVLTLKGHTGPVNSVILTPDDKYIISVSADSLKVWKSTNGDLIDSYMADERLTTCAVSPDGVTIVAGDLSGQVHFLRLMGKE